MCPLENFKLHMWLMSFFNWTQVSDGTLKSNLNIDFRPLIFRVTDKPKLIIKLKKTGTSSQDGGIGRYALLPHTTKKWITTNL